MPNLFNQRFIFFSAPGGSPEGVPKSKTPENKGETIPDVPDKVNNNPYARAAETVHDGTEAMKKSVKIIPTISAEVVDNIKAQLNKSDEAPKDEPT